MAGKYRTPEHPGVALQKEVIEPFNMSIRQFARALKVPPNRLARYLGCSPEFWLNLQAHYELELARRKTQNRIEREIKPRSAAA